MNTKLKPPCSVLFEGKKYDLRNLSYPNERMKRRGWAGLVAHIQNECGTTLAAYRLLKPFKD